MHVLLSVKSSVTETDKPDSPQAEATQTEASPDADTGAQADIISPEEPAHSDEGVEPVDEGQ